MRFRELCGPVLLATLSMVGGTALAQEPPAAPPPGAAEPPAAEPPAAAAPPVMAAEGGAGAATKMRVGLNVVPMPFGTLKASFGGLSGSSDTKFAIGAHAFFDYLFTPNLFGGLGVQYTFNLKSKDQDSGDASKELDIMLRLGGGGYVADKLQLYGYVSPGYSIVMLPSDAGGVDNPKGFIVGFHAGAMYDVTPGAFLNLEIGYQLGFQSTSVLGTSVDFKSNLAQIGVGGGIRF